jgi:hypothetical protein
MRAIAFAVVLAGCGDPLVPVISNLQCTPEMLTRTQPPYPIKCQLDVANDGGPATVTAIGADGLQVGVTGVVTTGDVGRVTVDFKLAADPFIGTLTVLVSVVGDSDGNVSNELTAQILVQ